MKFETRINGRYELILSPEDEIEIAVLQKIQANATLGGRLVVEGSADATVLVMERKASK